MCETGDSAALTLTRKMCFNATEGITIVTCSGVEKNISGIDYTTDVQSGHL